MVGTGTGVRVTTISIVVGRTVVISIGTVDGTIVLMLVSSSIDVAVGTNVNIVANAETGVDVCSSVLKIAF